MKKIIKYVMTDILRNRIVLVYTFFLLVTSFSVFSLEDNNSKGLLSLLNIILLIVPLVSIIFSYIPDQLVITAMQGKKLFPVGCNLQLPKLFFSRVVPIC